VAGAVDILFEGGFGGGEVLFDAFFVDFY